VLEAYYERFTAYAVDKSRVIVVEFQSRDPELAARVANSIAEGYLVLQQDARQQQAKSAEPVAVRLKSRACARRSAKPNRASRIFVPSRACSSAPTTPRCPTSRWARSIRS
jgi:capsular polysaccharide biosynthesis protein